MTTSTKTTTASNSLSHYVVVRDDLSPGLQLAYAVHAAGESVCERVPAGTRAVVLGCKDEASLRELASHLVATATSHEVIIEHDEAYSIGVCPLHGQAPDCLRSLELAGRPSPSP